MPACTFLRSPAFPSAAAEASSEMSKVDGDVRFKISAWKQSLVASFKHRSFLLLMLAVSVLSGVASGWQGVLQSILNPAGINAKWPGFGNGIAGNLAAVVSGVIVDKFFRRRLKTGIVLGLIACFAATLWFTLSLPSVFSSRSLLPESEASLTISLILAGFAQGTCTPLFYELAAEIVYPQSEGMSAGIIVCVLNLSSLVVILLNNYFNPGAMNFVMALTIVAVTIVVFFVKEEYKRPKS